jgi:hypothetical protein
MRKSIIIKYIAVLVVSISTLTINAQDKKIEFDVTGGYGLSGLSGKVENGSITPKTSYQFALNCKYFITSGFGIGIGGGYSSYLSDSELSGYTSNMVYTDDENESFEYRVTADGLKEQQQITTIDIPVFLALRKSLSEKLGVFGDIGLAVSVPLSAKYECNGGVVETRGYYSDDNVVLYDIPSHGFEKNENVTYSGDLTTNTSYSVFTNIGIKKPIGNIGLIIGVYGSYGLNAIVKPETAQLMIYPSKYQSITSLSDKVSLMSVGLKIGLRF